MPQLRDTAEVLAAAARMPGARRPRCWCRASGAAARRWQAGAQQLVFVLSVTEAHNRNNVRRHPLESVAEYERLLAAIPADVAMRLNLATAFDCPFTGRVPRGGDAGSARPPGAAAPGRRDLPVRHDGPGRPRPRGEPVRGVHGRGSPRPAAWALHAHDTYGLGLANVHAAFRQGVRVFDASFGGLGGCPFAPGATGNVATEDVVWMFERMGVATGIDLDALVAGRARGRGTARRAAGRPRARCAGLALCCRACGGRGYIGRRNCERPARLDARLCPEDPRCPRLRRRDREPARSDAAPVAAARQPGPAQARGPAAGLLLQAARRLQQDRRAAPGACSSAA